MQHFSQYQLFSFIEINMNSSSSMPLSPYMAKNEASKKQLEVTLRGSQSFLSINCMRLNHAYAAGFDMQHTKSHLGMF